MVGLNEASFQIVCCTHGQRCDSSRAQWSQRSGMTSLDPRVTRLVLRTKASNRRKLQRHFLHGVCAIWYSWNARHSDSLSPGSDPWGARCSCETRSGVNHRRRQRLFESLICCFTHSRCVRHQWLRVALSNRYTWGIFFVAKIINASSNSIIFTMLCSLQKAGCVFHMSWLYGRVSKRSLKIVRCV